MNTHHIYGPYEVSLSFKGHTYRNVKFLNTGYVQVMTFKRTLNHNNFKDPLHPTVKGKGYIGEGVFKPSTHKREYRTWITALDNPNLPTEWNNFNTFCSELEYLDGYEEWKGFHDTATGRWKDGKGYVFSVDDEAFIKRTVQADYSSRKSKMIVGSVWETNNAGPLTVVELKPNKKALIKFNESGITKEVFISAIRSGRVSN